MRRLSYGFLIWLYNCFAAKSSRVRCVLRLVLFLNLLKKLPSKVLAYFMHIYGCCRLVTNNEIAASWRAINQRAAKYNQNWAFKDIYDWFYTEHTKAHSLRVVFILCWPCCCWIWHRKLRFVNEPKAMREPEVQFGVKACAPWSHCSAFKHIPAGCFLFRAYNSYIVLFHHLLLPT